MVCGEHGTGKTTLIRIASKEVGCGVIYVDVPSADIIDFGKAFGKAINFASEECISFTEQLIRKLGNIDNESDDLMWERAMNAFKHAAKIYKMKYNRHAVIVYDNISSRFAHNSEILDILQDDAKYNADNRTYIAVFVSSEGSIPRRMRSRSSWSRVDQLIEIGDLSEYFDMRKIDKAEAEKLYQLVGGRVVDLKSVADKSLKGASFEKSILTKIEMEFKTAQLLENQTHYEVGKRIIDSLLESKELKYKTYMKFFDKAEESDEMLEKNVFQSKSVEFYIRENTDIFVGLIDVNNSNQATTSK